MASEEKFTMIQSSAQKRLALAKEAQGIATSPRKQRTDDPVTRAWFPDEIVQPKRDAEVTPVTQQPVTALPVPERRHTTGMTYRNTNYEQFDA